MSELSALAGSKRYGVSSDEARSAGWTSSIHLNKGSRVLVWLGRA